MNRRKFIFSATSILSLGTGCITDTLRHEIKKKDYRQYTETVDHILFSADEKNLVFISPEYHYIFDMPTDFLPLLNSPLRNKLMAKFDDFHVGLEAKTTGCIHLELEKDLDDNEKALAKTLGFKNFERRLDLQGLRYSAKDFDMPANIAALQKSYVVTVNEEQSSVLSAFRKPLVILTPLTMAADAIVFVGIALLALPFLVIYQPLR